MADDGIQIEGVIKEIHKGDMFTIELENGKEVLAKPAGKLRHHKIKLLPHDKVLVKLSVYNLNLGIIVYRYK